MDTENNTIATINSTLKSEHPPESQEFAPSRDVWYKDGSVVLVTEKVAFRVHTSILALNCDVFKDMVDISQASGDVGESDTYEGCPVVRLQDSAIDMQYFLKAI